MNPRLLAKALATARAVPFSGTAFRMVPKAFADPAQALSGVGAARRGGRWNPQGVRAVYLSEDAELLAREVGYAQSLGGAFGARPKPPMVLYSVEFELVRVLHVDEAFVARIGAGWSDLLREDWAAAIGRGDLTAAMRIGQAAYYARLEALVAPSAQDPARERWNLVVFPDNLLAGSRLEIVGA